MKRALVSISAVSVFACGSGVLGLGCSESDPAASTGGSQGSTTGATMTGSSGGLPTGSTSGTSGGGTGTPTGASSTTGTTGGMGTVGTTGTTGATTAGTTGVGGATSTGVTGTDTTGSSTTGPPDPSLVTSGENSAWQAGSVTEGGTSADFTVNSSETHQPWHGFGGTFNEQGWQALSALSPELREQAMHLLFDPSDGIGFDWGRIPMGPSDYAVERYTLSDSPGHFDITHDLSYLIPYIQAAQQVKSDVKYWASPWTPPPWAKTEGQNSDGLTLPMENGGYDKGIFNSTYYQQYADYFVAWIQAYESQGIPIDAVMPQNEPGWAQSYPTSGWGPATDSGDNTGMSNIVGPVTLGTFVDGYLFPSIAAAGLTTKVWYGTLSNDATFDAYWGDMMSKPSAAQLIGGALQWETIVRTAEVAASKPEANGGAGYLVMQSEHRCGNYPWKDPAASKQAADYDTFWAAEAPNNHNYGVESWGLMRDWIQAGVNIYSAWNMVLDTGGFNLDLSRPWPQNAMIVVDEAAGTMQVTSYYYVFRHIAQYVDVGAQRVSVTGDALAFKNPDSSIVTIMFNPDAAPKPSTLSVDGTLLQFEIPARGWATVNWPG